MIWLVNLQRRWRRNVYPPIYLAAASGGQRIEASELTMLRFTFLSQGLFLAGKIIRTTGYEETAA